MTNWFERNATPAIISYTLLVAGATWAMSTFVLEDNRLNLLRSELESQKTLAEQYKAKSELLMRDIDLVREENAEYRDWLGRTESAIPIMIPIVTDLRRRLAELETEAQKLRSTPDGALKSDSEGRVSLGRAYIDTASGVILTLKRTSPDRTAEMILQFPHEPQFEGAVFAGKRWQFKGARASYSITLTEISFLTDTVSFIVREMG